MDIAAFSAELQQQQYQQQQQQQQMQHMQHMQGDGGFAVGGGVVRGSGGSGGGHFADAGAGAGVARGVVSHLRRSNTMGAIPHGHYHSPQTVAAAAEMAAAPPPQLQQQRPSRSLVAGALYKSNSVPPIS